MKILKRVVEGGVRKFVRIDNMYYGFMADNGGGNLGLPRVFLKIVCHKSKLHVVNFTGCCAVV